MDALRALLLLTLLTTVLLGPKSARAESISLRLMTYNIQHGADFRQRVDLDRAAATIKAVAPDVAFLSEVDSGWRRSGYQDQPVVLSEKTGMDGVYYSPALTSISPAVTRIGGRAQYGNLFLAHVPIVGRGVYPLPTHPRREPRNLLYIDVVAGSATIRIYGTHLSVSEGERRRQWEAIRAILAHSPYPAIIMGDFNAGPQKLRDEAPFLFDGDWVDAFAWKGEGDGATFPVPQPQARIDYIWVDGTLKERLQATWVAQSEASDHLPVIAELLFPRP